MDINENTALSVTVAVLLFYFRWRAARASRATDGRVGELHELLVASEERFAAKRREKHDLIPALWLVGKRAGMQDDEIKRLLHLDGPISPELRADLLAALKTLTADQPTAPKGMSDEGQNDRHPR